MTGAEVLAVITGFFKFFPEVRKLILMLQKTPEEKRQARLEMVNVIFDEVINENRPKW